MNCQSYVSSVFTIETQFRKYTFKIKCNVWLNLLRMILFILLLYKLFSTIAINNFFNIYNFKKFNKYYFNKLCQIE